MPRRTQSRAAIIAQDQPANRIDAASGIARQLLNETFTATAQAAIEERRSPCPSAALPTGLGVAVVVLVAVVTIGVAVFFGGGEPASAPVSNAPSAPVPEILLRAPIHTDAAERMRPGALAALQLTTLLDADMEARAQTAALLWDFYASHIEECLSAKGDHSQLSRIEVSPGDDPTWDLIREPNHEFHPTDEEWNRLHGFSSRDSGAIGTRIAASLSSRSPSTTNGPSPRTRTAI
ncbi:MAG: hypothetical protein GY708_17820 [Actinomycetia bacterium]|nr:hypothetical protein [Actinomycetes bacterium]